MGRLRFTFLFLIVCMCSASMGFGGFSTCKEAERKALSKLKHGLVDRSNRLGSWAGEDCCSWKGVGCDNVTGHVIKLDLGGHHDIFSASYLEAGEVNPALLELKYLKYLDLSNNDFNRSRIPEFLGSMRQLQYLNLSYAYFGGQVPRHLGNLTKLVFLDLGKACFGCEMEANSLEWASKLENLQYLDLSAIDLSRALDTLDVLHKLPSLLVSNLASCRLGNHHQVIRNPNVSSSPLRHLDLHLNRFSGPIPHFIQNFSSLGFLDLSFNYLNHSTRSLILGNNIDLRLENLQYLDLSWNDLSQAPDSLNNILHNLPSLLVLNLAYCRLGTPHQVIRNPNVSSSPLQHLDLGFNDISGPFPYFIQNLSSLRFLDLSYNNFSSPIPSWLGNKIDLEYLSLGDNSFSGSFPHFIGNWSFLTSLDLSYNQFRSSIPSWLANKPYLEHLDLSNNRFNSVDGGIINTISCSLKYLDLSYNQLQEEVLNSHFNLSRCTRYELELLYLSNNYIDSHLPIIGSLSSLQDLDLSHNNLETLPPSLGKLSSLSYLNVASNHLSVVHQASLANLSSLRYLDISSNSLILDLSLDWMPPFQLFSLSILPCKLNSPFPNWLLSQKQISELDLSDTGMFGPIPHNIGNAMPSLQSLRLANNHINGSIPRSLCELASLNLLDLKKNMLSGMIPDCWGNSQILSVELSSNGLSGSIPNSLTKVGTLQLLSLNNNSLEGELPLSSSNWANLMVLDVGRNKLDGKIPPWNRGNLPSLHILILRENRFSGTIPLQLCSVHTLQIIDLANNNLVGTIPQCFDHFEGMSSIQRSPGFTKSPSSVMPPPPPPPPPPGGGSDKWSAVEVIKGEEREYTTVLHLLVNMDLSCNNLVGAIPENITSLSLLVSLNLSYNHLMGTIPKEIGKMKSLESLDLSRNSLSGSIPESLSSLNSLSKMNLSFNNLQGQIPTGSQLQTLEDPSIYMGNPGLCGDPLPKKCFRDSTAHPPTSTVLDDEEDDDTHEKMWFYLVIVLGFATGFWGVIGILVVKKRWRYAYFQPVEDLADWIYVRVVARTARAK